MKSSLGIEIWGSSAFSQYLIPWNEISASQEIAIREESEFQIDIFLNAKIERPSNEERERENERMD